MNTIQLIGRITKKPELRTTNSDNVVCNFDIAVNRDYKVKDEQAKVDYIKCQVWNKPAENLVQYQDKGSLISVEGTLRVENYKNQDGESRTIAFVRANKIEYLSAKKNNDEPQANDYDDFSNEVIISDDDLPF